MAGKPRIIVLGANGMLGQMAVKYFSSKNYEVITTNIRFEEATKWELIHFLHAYPDAFIINGIGRIKQKSNDEQDLLWSNTLFPLHLSRYLLPTQQLIHASTDCVFSGATNSPYKLTDSTDATDSYGWSKILAEQALLGKANVLIVRVSIIGADNSDSGKGLLKWFLSNAPGSKLNGFTNHLWNGITTLEWCKQVEQLALTTTTKFGGEIIQLGTKEHYTKYELLELFQNEYKTKFEINRFESNQAIDRRLEPTIYCPSLTIQLKEMREFWKIHLI